MSLSLRHRRRAERFAQLLDEASGGRRQHLRTPLDDELAELVALRHELVATDPGPEVDPEFRTGLRAMLVATAEREGLGRTAQPDTAPSAPSAPSALTAPAPRPAGFARAARGPRARTAVVAGVAVGAVAFTGMSTASENAVPGDALYGVKRSTERAQLALASSDVGRGQLYLDFARTRLAEAGMLSGDSGDLDRVLADMDRDTSQGVRLLTSAAANRQDLAALDAIEAFTAGQRRTLERLAGRVTGADLALVRSSLDLLDTIDARTAELRQSLADCAGTSVTSIDWLGPVPRDCVALPAPDALDRGPGAAGGPAAPLAQPGAAEQAQPDRPAAPAPDHPTDPPVPADPADPDNPADPDPDAGTEADPDSPDEPQDEQGGLLSGLNRLLGSLLGG